jgi:hypothetical protein
VNIVGLKVYIQRKLKPEYNKKIKEKKRIKELERELRRKEKALAEKAALAY